MADDNNKDQAASGSGRIRRLGAWVWGIATGALGIAFVFGILFWGGFNTAMEWTNREEFCISRTAARQTPTSRPSTPG